MKKMRGAAAEINPESIALCANLENTFEILRNNHQLVHAQVSEMEENVRKLRSFLTQESADYARAKDKLLDRQRYYESAAKQLTDAKDGSHEHLVENSLFKMRVHQMEHMETRLMGYAFNLEKQKAELELVVNERLITIQAEVDLLGIRKKTLADEQSQLRADICDRKRYIDAMMARFELTSDLLGRNEDGSAIQAVQLKVQMAQEKVMLLKHGSDLNEKVITAERDISALENTLILMNYSNDKYKRGLEQVLDDDGRLAFFRCCLI